MSKSICTIKSLDHLVLYCKSVQATIAFYQKLGMRHQPFTTNTPTGNEPQTRHALVYGAQKINLHDASSPFKPHASVPKPGTADLCFLAEEEVGTIRDRLRVEGIEILEGGDVVQRTGAKSKLRSVYVNDPDGNLIEISNEVE